MYLFPTELDENDVNLLPKEPGEEIARLFVPKFDAYLTELTDAHFDFIGISAARPLKPKWQWALASNTRLLWVARKFSTFRNAGMAKLMCECQWGLIGIFLGVFIVLAAEVF